MKDTTIIERTQLANQEASSGDALEISESAKEHVLMVLTNMYREPVKASCREYLSNAKDAQTRADNMTDPIELGWNSESYFIRDYGTGMDIADLKSKFFKYGESDKRDNIEEIGGFGLGCKAGLAVNGKLEVTSWKDGYKYHAVATLRDGVNNITYSTPEKSSEKNGTFVRVPFEKSSFYHEHLIEMFNEPRGILSFWYETVPLSINGVLYAPKPSTTPISKSAYTVVDAATNANIWAVREEYYQSQIVISLGGVPYNIDVNKLKLSKEAARIIRREPYRSGYEHVYSYYIDVPMSSLVKLVPSRDSILYDENTVNNLNEIISSALESVSTYVKDMFNQTELPETDLILVKHSRILFTKNGRAEENSVMWRGKKITPIVHFDNSVYKFHANHVNPGKKVLHMKRNYAVANQQEKMMETRVLIQVNKNTDMSSDEFNKLLIRNWRTLAKHLKGVTNSSRFFFYYTHDASEILNDEMKRSLFQHYYASEDELNKAGLDFRRANKVTYEKRTGVDDEPKHYTAGAVTYNANRNGFDYAGAKFLSNNEIKALSRVVIVDENRYAKHLMGGLTAQKLNRSYPTESVLYKMIHDYPNETFVIVPVSRKVSVITKLNSNAITPYELFLETVAANQDKYFENLMVAQSVPRMVSFLDATADRLNEYPKIQALHDFFVNSLKASEETVELYHALKHNAMSMYTLQGNESPANIVLTGFTHLADFKVKRAKEDSVFNLLRDDSPLHALEFVNVKPFVNEFTMNVNLSDEKKITIFLDMLERML